jgi:hypothetical protein
MRLLVLAMLILSGSIVYAGEPVAVAYDELQAHPGRYNGKRVTFRAYLITSCAHCRDLWASVARAHSRCAHENTPQNEMYCGALSPRCKTPKGFPDKLVRQEYDGYVRITGTFQYVHTVDPSNGKGFGWSLLDDKQMTGITELQPLGRPIPFHYKW